MKSKLTIFSFGVIILIVTAVSTSCGGSEGTNTATTSDTLQVAETYNYDTLKGIYYGDMNDEAIRIVITYISNKHVVGYDVHRGIQRNLSGTFTDHGDMVEMTLTEPGDHPYDGVFTLEIEKDNFSVVANWKANDRKIPALDFTLEKNQHKELAEEDYDNPFAYNNENFSFNFYSVNDSLGTIYFETDGNCQYIEVENIRAEDKLENIKQTKGNWKISKGTVFVEWKDSTFFPLKSKFIITPQHDASPMLVGEGREFERFYY